MMQITPSSRDVAMEILLKTAERQMEVVFKTLSLVINEWIVIDS
jgi:hypothetical protein